ncbi:hypothetical protein ACC691_37615, partial [Rhizobium johnstonii]|uniref:hypothetical protein n=1 Tax=Rhizobium johnstonii TaxID=3019933 RepID=UPI003F9C241E
GYSDDAELASALQTVGEAAYVQDQDTGAAYVVDGMHVEPLNKRATTELPLPASIGDFQKRLLARATEARDESGAPSKQPAPAPSNTTIDVLVAVIVLVATLAVIAV